MSTWLLPRSELTPEQLRAIELPHTQHQVVFGAPGSGKTQILLHRAAELSRRLHAQPGGYRIFVYTNVLKNYIRSALDLLELPENVVMTFDDWCKTFHEKHIGHRLPWDFENRRPDFEAIRRAVAHKIATNTVPMPLYDFVLVDEGQDLEPACFEMIRRIAQHVTVCLDHKQQIYERGSQETQILAALGLRQRNLTLLDAYRCSPYVARLAAQLIDDPIQQQQYLRQVRTEQTEREAPLLYEASSFEDEKQRLIRVLRQRLLVDQRVALLFPTRRQVFGFAQALLKAGVDAETQENLDFSSGRPKLITFHSAKGLTFDSVLLPRLVATSFPRVTVEHTKRLLFVAITRATRWVYLSTHAGENWPILNVFYPLARERLVTIQHGGGNVVAPPPVGESPNQSDLDFL